MFSWFLNGFYLVLMRFSRGVTRFLQKRTIVARESSSLRTLLRKFSRLLLSVSFSLSASHEREEVPGHLELGGESESEGPNLTRSRIDQDRHEGGTPRELVRPRIYDDPGECGLARNRVGGECSSGVEGLERAGVGLARVRRVGAGRLR